MNLFLDIWATTMWRACWQGGLVVVAVWTICRLLPSMPARFQCWLWRLAILKFMVVLLVPWFFNLPLLPAQRAPERVAFIPVASDTLLYHEPLGRQTAPATPVPTPVLTPAPLVRPVASPASVPSLSAVLFVAWIVGVGWSLTRLLAGWRFAWRLRHTSSPIEDAMLREQLVNQAAAFGVRRPELRSLSGMGSPMLVGFLRPAILFPEGTLGRLSVSERTMVLGHELAHVKRGDLFWGLTASIVHALFFFHPLIWLGKQQLKLAQEIAADELGINRQRRDPVGYGQLLVSVVSKFGPVPKTPSPSVETMGSAKTLARRLNAMKVIGRASRRIFVSSSILLTAVLLLGVVPWRLVAAEDKAIVEAKSPAAMPTAQATPRPSTLHCPERFFFWTSDPNPQQRTVLIRVVELMNDHSGCVRCVPSVTFLLSPPAFESFRNGDLRPAVTARLLPGRTPPQHEFAVKLIRESYPNSQNAVAMTQTFTVAGDIDAAEAQRELSSPTSSASFPALLATNDPPDPGEVEIKPLTDHAAEVAVISLDLTWTTITDEDIERLKHMTTLQSLDLSGTSFTDAGLEQLRSLAHLKSLTLRGAKVTDKGLSNLNHMTTLQSLNLRETRVSDAGLEKLHSLPHLKSLNLRATEVTDNGLSHLKRFPELRSLNLEDLHKITDAGLNHLKDLPELQVLYLAENDLTDAGLVHLKGLTRLEALGLSSNQVTDAGLEHLKGLNDLQDLNLAGCGGVGDAGLEHLKGLTKLKTLSLFGTNVSDVGLKHLKGLANLESLYLICCKKVTDAGLQELEGLNRLALLRLAYTEVTAAGVTKLRQALPKCKIEWSAATESGPANSYSPSQRADTPSAIGAAPTVVPTANPPTRAGTSAEVESRPDDEVAYGTGSYTTAGPLPYAIIATPSTFEPTAEEAKAIAEIKKLGGKVTVEESTSGKSGIIAILDDAQVTDAGLEQIVGLSRLRNLSLGNTKVTDAGLEHLKGLSELQWLNLSGTKVTDAGLQHLSNLSTIQGVYLANTQVTDFGLESLKGLSKLQFLDLNHTQITDAGLEHLKGLSKLQSLCLGGTKVTDAGLERLEGFSQFLVLILANTKVTDAGLEHLKNLSKLQWLYLDGTNVTDKGVKKLQQALPKCEINWSAASRTYGPVSTVGDPGVLSPPPVPVVGANTFDRSPGMPTGEAKAIAEIERIGGAVWFDSKGPGKRAIIVSYPPKDVTNEQLAPLEQLPMLRSLSLHFGTKITDAGLVHLKGLSDLRRLDLGYTSVTDEGLTQLKYLTKLETLDLTHTKIGDKGLAQLNCLEKLENLDLSDTKVSDEGLAQLEGLPNLKEFHLAKTGLADDGLKYIARLKNLRSLEICQTHVTDDGVAKIAGMTGLESLNLGGTSVTDAGLVHVKRLVNLQCLLLWETKVSDAGMIQLPGLTKLQRLYLHSTNLTDAGLAPLSTMTQLRELTLYNTKVSRAGVKKLRAQLPSCMIEQTQGNGPAAYHR